LIAGTGYNNHIYQMIEQLIFTAPGERVNRPNFGCGLDRLVFTAGSDEMVTVTQSLVLGELQKWLGDLIRVETVQVRMEESTLSINIRYIVLKSGQRREDLFKQSY